MAQHRVFVYGTLMSGLRNHHLMEGAKFTGSAQTLLPSYEMIQFPSVSAPGHFTPGVLRKGNACISGEVYLVDDHVLNMLDDLEQVGVEYERSKVMLSDGSQAWTYFLIADKAPCGKDIPSFVKKDGDVCLWDGAGEESFVLGQKAA